MARESSISLHLHSFHSAPNFRVSKGICMQPADHTPQSAHLHRVKTCQSSRLHFSQSPPPPTPLTLTLTLTPTLHRPLPRTTFRQHALQQHSNCSFQGDHGHCVPAAYVCLYFPSAHERQQSESIQRSSTKHTSNISLVARVKKIISQDDDINSCSNNAAFVITVATEMFLQHLVEQSHNVVKSERKPRRNIQYRDVGMCLLSRIQYYLGFG